MPTYEYLCKACQFYFTINKHIPDMHVPAGEPCPECGEMRVEKVIMSPTAFGDPVRLGIRRPDGGFTDRLKEIHKNTPGSIMNTNSRYI